MKLDFNLIDTIKKIIFKTRALSNTYNFVFPNQKHKLDDILNEILYVLKTGVSWNALRSSINYKTLWFHFNRFKKHNIFKRAYDFILKKYQLAPYKISNEGFITDTSFIKNNLCINRVARNKYFKNKKCFKLSIITDFNKIPISILVNRGNESDFVIFEKHKLNKLTSKGYFLADAGYDSKRLRNILKNNDFYPIIAYNKRNTKDDIIKKSLSESEKTIYKKRIRIENVFCYLKKYKRIETINEKHYSTYLNFLYLAILNLICRN